MSLTRRGVLAAAALAQGSLLSGCFGDDTTQASDSADGAASTERSTSDAATSTPSAAASETATPTATPVAGADLATATANILSEFEWFRTEYDATITQFRIAVNRVLTVVTELEAAENRTEADVETLRAATTELAEFVQANLTDHFAVAPALRTGDNVYVSDLERGVSRGDRELQDQSLALARSFYRRITSNEYVSNELSQRPVYGPLYDMLIPGGATDRIVAIASEDGDFLTWAHPDLDESSADDGIDRHSHRFPSEHRVFTHAHSHSIDHRLSDHANEPAGDRLYAYAYGGGGVALLVDGASYRNRLDDFEPAVTGLFDPVTSESHARGATVLIGTADEEWASTPVHVETFETVEAARDATRTTDAVRSEGVTSLAERDWERIFYDVDGTTIYAYRLRAGPAVFTALPSDVPWERRSEWGSGLAGTWLATE